MVKPDSTSFVVRSLDGSVVLMLTWSFHNIHQRNYRQQLFDTFLECPGPIPRVHAFGTQIACYEVLGCRQSRLHSGSFAPVEGSDRFPGPAGYASWGVDILEEFGYHYLIDYLSITRQQTASEPHISSSDPASANTITKWTQVLDQQSASLTLSDVRLPSPLNPRLAQRKLSRASTLLSQVWPLVSLKFKLF